ncbi:hypothetical protein B0H14DRAFT_2583421 [Mycena olivaceomarginata]|nr:hypothetical protein B0H14DRAFT_2583421 [Mycena olivaceomarginata]
MDGVGNYVERAIDLRKKCGHFRILVIGRANAGKTTILKKVCDSTKDPKIFIPTGKKLKYPSVKVHFHDSRGFESGSVKETEKVKAFIEKRAATRDLSEQLHAIWYCLPTDTQRPLLEADTQFFNYSGTGKGEFSLLSLPRLTERGCKVPVIAIFTKFDGLVTTAFQNLRAEGKTRQEAMADAPNMAQRILTTDYIDQLKKMNFSPSDLLYGSDMREKTSTCIELMAKTANSLNENALRLLLVSVQRNNLGLCIYYAVKEGLEGLTDLASARWFAETTLSYFPHIWHEYRLSMLPSLQEAVSGYFSHLPPLGLAEHAAIPAVSEHAVIPAGTEHAAIPAGTEHAAIPAVSEHAAIPAATEHAAIPAGSEHAAIPAVSEHAPIPAATEHAAIPAGTEHAAIPAASEHAAIPAASEHAAITAGTEHAAIPAVSEHAAIPAGSEHAAIPAGTEHAPIPAVSEHAAIPAATEHAAIPAATEHAAFPAGTEHAAIPAGTEHAPIPAATEHAAIPAATEHAAIPAATEHAAIPAGSEHTAIPAATEHAAIPAATEHAAIPAGRSEHHILAPASASEIADISFLSDMLCICAEQTFTEESAVDKHFGPAFSRVMEAYIGSSTEAEVIKEIKETVDLPEIRFQQTSERIHDQAKMLTKIIKRHPLRM